MVKNNSDTAMKAQMTLDRMSLELRDSSSISVLTDNSLITYKVSGYNPSAPGFFREPGFRIRVQKKEADLQESTDE